MSHANLILFLHHFTLPYNIINPRFITNQMEKTMYWKAVLDEVLNKRRIRRFTFTTTIKPKIPNNRTKSKPNNSKKLKIYSLGKQHQNIHFSQREAECMALLLTGKRIRTIANMLNLSTRTIEFYLKNMKKKLNCRTKFELIDLVRCSDFQNNINGVI